MRLATCCRLKNETYNLTDLFDVSSPGTYRFKTDCYVPDKAEKSTKCELVAEFTVGNVDDAGAGKVAGTEVEWAAQYVRTNGYSEGVLYPSVRIIDSLQELKDYYNTWHEVFDLARKEKVYSDTTIGFLDVCDQYDETFFEKNYWKKAAARSAMKFVVYSKLLTRRSAFPLTEKYLKWAPLIWPSGISS